jgi:hypothetical protein
VKQTALYLLVDTSKTKDGLLHPDIKKAIHLLLFHLNGSSFNQQIDYYAINLDRNPTPEVQPLPAFKERKLILKRTTHPIAGLDLAASMTSFIKHVEDNSYKNVMPIFFLNERSGTSVLRQIKQIESMENIIQPFLIIAFNETAKLHKKNIPNAIWIDFKDFLDGYHSIISSWFSTIKTIVDTDIIKNFGYDPNPSLQCFIEESQQLSSLNLIPKEFEGPIIINKPLTIDGRGATIWVKKGPGVLITSDGVKLKNLRIEVTEKHQINNDLNCALKVETGIKTEVENLLVRGTVCGLEMEEGQWEFPYVLDLGILPSRTAFKRFLHITVPTEVTIESKIDGLKIDINMLHSGMNELSLKFEPMIPNTLIHGTILLQTPQITRTINVRGYVVAENEDKEKLRLLESLSQNFYDLIERLKKMSYRS